jgi:hypothetical protein
MPITFCRALFVAVVVWERILVQVGPQVFSLKRCSGAPDIAVFRRPLDGQLD